ncbi:hypothetical protein JHK87_006232 [Glycine soja]|nr:hypothetical protein JHK87_006232 [Glycine soja]
MGSEGVPSMVVEVMSMATVELTDASSWWHEIDDSPAWQDRISYTLVVLYGIVATVALVSRTERNTYLKIWSITTATHAIKVVIAYEGLKHRVFEVSLTDLQGDEDDAFKKIRLRAEDVQGKNVLTNF